LNTHVHTDVHTEVTQPPETSDNIELPFSRTHLLETRASLASAGYSLTLGDTLNSIRWVPVTQEVAGSSPVDPVS
jgi:hypothetical protein